MKQLIMAAVCICGFSATAENITSESLKGLIETRNTPALAAKAEAKAAADREERLMRSFLPSLELQAGQEQFQLGQQKRKNQPVYGAEATVNLYNGGRDALEEKVHKAETERRTSRAQRIQSEELEQARSLYWQILYLSEKTPLLQASIDLNKNNLAAAGRRIKSGVATNSDRFEFEMKDVELKRDLAVDQIEMKKLRRSLALLLGFEEEKMKLSEKLGHDHHYEKKLSHTSKDHEFLYKETELMAEQLQLNASKEARTLWPQVDAFAGYTQWNEREEEYPEARDRTETVIGLRARLSLDTGFQARREGAALKQEAAAAQMKVAYAKKEIEVHLQAELDELQLLHTQVHEAEENIKRAEGYYKLTQGEYGRGVKNSPDVLNASVKLFDMKHKHIQILRDFQLARAHLLSKLGR